MNSNPWWSRLVRMISVIAIVLVVAEIGLSFKKRGDRESEVLRSRGEQLNLGDADLICIGNSQTEALHVPPASSYCRQIEAIAAEKGKKIRTQVWAGPMSNTSEILEDLKQKLPKSRPRVALVMAGEGNFFNFRGYEGFKNRQQEPSPASGSKSFWDSVAERSALLSLFRKDEAAREGSELPFTVVDKANDLEVAYRWLSWARTNFPTVRLTDNQAKQALLAMERVKKTDPKNVAADLVSGEISAIHFQDFETAMKHFEAVPKDHQACLAFLEAPNFETSSVEGGSHLVQYFARIWQLWSLKFNREELVYIRYVLNFSRDVQNAGDFLSTDMIRKNKKVKQLLETLNECGTPADTGMYALNLSDLQNDDPMAALKRMERHLALFPLSPNIDHFQLINAIQSGTKETPELKQRVESSRTAFQAKFGGKLNRDEIISNDAVKAWTESELTEIADLLKQDGAEVVFMTYPPQPFRGTHPIKKTPVEDLPGHEVDEGVRSVAGKRELRLFDTASILRARFKDKPNLKEFYSFQMGAADSHLSASGYRVLAEELYDFLEKEKLF